MHSHSKAHAHSQALTVGNVSIAPQHELGSKSFHDLDSRPVAAAASHFNLGNRAAAVDGLREVELQQRPSVSERGCHDRHGKLQQGSVLIKPSEGSHVICWVGQEPAQPRLFGVHKLGEVWGQRMVERVVDFKVER